MTSRHNERLQARRHALREQHKRELEDAKRRQAAQLASVTTFDQRIAKLEEARSDVAAAVAEAVTAFGGRRDAAAALGLTAAEAREYLNTHERHAAAPSGAGPTAETAETTRAAEPSGTAEPNPSAPAQGPGTQAETDGAAPTSSQPSQPSLSGAHPAPH